MKRLLYASLLSLVFSTTFGQNLKTEISGNKQMISISREIPNFSHLRIMGLNVDLQKAEANSISVNAESNIIEHIITKVNGDTLVIHFEENQPLREITVPTVNLKFKNLYSILGSASDIKLLSVLEGDSLLVKLQTKSSIEGVVRLNFLDLSMATTCSSQLSGSANIARAELFTKSNLKGKDLTINDLYIIEETFCDVEVNVAKRLTAKLFAEST